MSLEEIIKIVEGEFEEGKKKQVGWKKLIKMLQERGFEYEDVDEALDEAERRKIIELDSGFYKWIDPSVREAEKAKTQRYYDMLAEIFEGGKIAFLTEEEVKAALKERGLDDEEAAHILAIAERDFVLDFYADTFGPAKKLVAGCSWIPSEDRASFADAEKESNRSFKKWLEKKIMQGDY